MAGHSHWAGIKYKKAIADSKKGKIFSKLSKLIIQAAKGGADPGYNVKLKNAIEKAQYYNMPKDKITTAIKKGSGQLEGYNLEEMVYEGYGPGGIAIMVETLSDNTNRTTPEIRHIFEKRNCSLGSPGCVSWKFTAKGLFLLTSIGDSDEDEFLEMLIENGMEDYLEKDGSYEIYTAADSYAMMKECLEKTEVEFKASITKIPNSYVPVDENGYKKILGLMEALEDNEDVQEVYADFDVSEEVVNSMEEIQ